MDMTMVDVTDIENIEIGTEVTVFGKDPTISDLALAAETIPYEVFTNLSGRVKRIYTYD
jgi:alanine racemase